MVKCSGAKIDLAGTFFCSYNMHIRGGTANGEYKYPHMIGSAAQDSEQLRYTSVLFVLQTVEQ